MLRVTSPAGKAVGFWSAVLATVFSLVYVVAQLGEWVGLLGSGGGPESASTATGLVVLLLPSLLLGSAFLALLVSVHQAAPPEGRIWSQMALAFGVVYTVLISMTYFVQLTLVAPRIAQGRTAGIEAFLFVPFDSFLYSVDLLGYSFMSAATLFLAPVFSGPGLERTARAFLVANGLLIPFLVGQLYVHALIWPASAWAVTFPGAAWSLALLFRRAEVMEASLPGGVVRV
jgi:hypothetical protein